MATHSSILAWRIPWTEEPGRLQAMGSQSRTQLRDFHFHFDHKIIFFLQRKEIRRCLFSPQSDQLAQNFFPLFSLIHGICEKIDHEERPAGPASMSVSCWRSIYTHERPEFRNFCAKGISCIGFQ